MIFTPPPYTFNQPARDRRDRRSINRAPTTARPRPYANDPDPTTTGELLLLAIKASA